MSMLACQYNQPKRPGDLTFDLLTLKVVPESHVTWATSAHFSLPRPLCSRVRPDVRDRQTSDRQTSDCQTKASLNVSE